MPLPHGVSIGQDASGSFRTAALKEYPPMLCKAFALAFLDSLEGVAWTEDTDAVYTSYADMVMPHDVYWDMGQDFLG